MSAPPTARQLGVFAPWRQVIGIERLRKGWAIFLECPGHIMFMDAFDARNEGPPKKMRCRTCAGLARPDYIDRKKPTREEIAHIMRGGELASVSRAAAVFNAIDRVGRSLLARTTRHGVASNMHTIAERCGRSRT